MSRRVLLGVPALVIAVVMAAGWITLASRQDLAPLRARTLVLQGSRIGSLVPIASTSIDDFRVFRHVMEALLVETEDGAIGPGLARSFTERGAVVTLLPRTCPTAPLDTFRDEVEGLGRLSFLSLETDADLERLLPETIFPSDARALRAGGCIHPDAIHFRAAAYDQALVDALAQIARAHGAIVIIAPVIEFETRPGARFHDLPLDGDRVVPGRPLTWEDIDFSIRLCRQDPTLSALFADTVADPNPRADCREIREWRRLRGEPLRFEVVLHRPTLRHPWMWTDLWMYPSYLYVGDAAEEVARAPDSGPTLGTSLLARWPVGTGRFRVVEHDLGNRIVLERAPVPSPPPGAVPIDRIEFWFVPDEFTQQTLVDAAVFDVFRPSTTLVGHLDGRPAWRRFDPVLPARTAYDFVCFNMRRPIFAGPPGSPGALVRQALAHAIPYEAIIADVYKGLGKRLTGPFHPESDWYDREVPPITYSPAVAEQLLDEAGWRRRGGEIRADASGAFLRIRLVTSGSRDPAWVHAQAVIAYEWSRLGVDVVVVTQEINTFLSETIVPFDFDASIIGIGVTRNELRARNMWHSEASSRGGYNISGFATADDLIDALDATVDPDTRNAIGRRIHRAVADWTPYAFLVIRTQVAYGRNDIRERSGNAIREIGRFPYFDFPNGILGWVRVSDRGGRW